MAAVLLGLARAGGTGQGRCGRPEFDVLHILVD
jgi:hypothetical protein